MGEKELLQDEFDKMHEQLNQEQKAEVFYNIQRDAEVYLTRFEAVAHDPVYEPDPDPETDCKANEDPGGCQIGSTNSNTRKKHREMRDIFELTKSKREREVDNKELGAGMLSKILDIPTSEASPDVGGPGVTQTKKGVAEYYIKKIQSDPTNRKKNIKEFEKQFLEERGCCFDASLETKKAIVNYIESSKMLDIEDNKEKAQNALDRAKFLSDSEKEIFKDFLDADDNDQSEEGKKK